MKISHHVSQLYNHFRIKASQVNDYKIASEPFYLFAKEALSKYNVENVSDDIPVYQINKKKITVGDCRKLVKLVENSSLHG